MNAIPVTGNESVGVYIVIVAVAGLLVAGAVIAGIISKKKKK